MNTGSVLSQYFACSGDVENEDEWLAENIARLKDEVTRGELERARESCERFRVELEGHFAFEELVIARTGFRSGHRHYAEHSAGLVAINELVRAMHRAAGDPTRSKDCEKLLEQLSTLQHHAEAHLARQDMLLRQHAARTAGLPDE